MKIPYHFKELLCVVFGHEMNTHGKSTMDDGSVDEWWECYRCEIETHIRTYKKPS